jgi:hypothetical protein
MTVKQLDLIHLGSCVTTGANILSKQSIYFIVFASVGTLDEFF